MNRLEVFRLVTGTNEILGTPEIKKTLTGKEIYALSKLNRKLNTENDRTYTKQKALQSAFSVAVKDLDEEQKKSLTDKFNDDWKAVYDEQVENPVEVLIPFENAEGIMRSVKDAQVTNTLLEYLIDAPKE